MGNWLEWKYVGLLAPQLYNYKVKGNRLINFSCPFCDEYHTSSHKRKARGYVLDHGEHYHYFCHRCGASMIVPVMLKRIDETLYLEFLKELLQEGNRPRKVDSGTPLRSDAHKALTEPLRRVQRVSMMAPDHPARAYAERRKIPRARMRELYYAPKFMAWVNSFLPDKFSEDELRWDEPRLVIPFFWQSPEGETIMHCVQGRSFKPKSDLKYITIVIDEDVPSLYGLDRFDVTENGFVVEGPLDAMFLPNCIASAGGDLISKLGKFNKSKLTVVYDNEPRSETTLTKMYRAIKAGFRVCVWPSSVEEKDINDMVLAGRTPAEITNIINLNSVQGLKAELVFRNWRKI